jgi:hypothetical protein
MGFFTDDDDPDDVGSDPWWPEVWIVLVIFVALGVISVWYGSAP